jgi:hypothetical protein
MTPTGPAVAIQRRDPDQRRRLPSIQRAQLRPRGQQRHRRDRPHADHLTQPRHLAGQRWLRLNQFGDPTLQLLQLPLQVDQVPLQLAAHGRVRGVLQPVVLGTAQLLHLLAARDQVGQLTLRGGVAAGCRR